MANYNPIGKKFSELIKTGLDSDNTSSVTETFDISENDFLSWQVLAKSGSHSSHILTLQCSFDDVNWQNTSSTITGVGFKNNVQMTTKYMRVKVTTAEGSASTVDVIIQAK